MVWFYLSFFLLMIALSIILRIIGLRTIRVFGFEMLGFLFILFFLTLIIGEILVPMPQYYIKHQTFSDNFESSSKFSLNRILEYDIPGREHIVQDITKIAQRSNIVVEQGYSSWMRPCPNCKSDNTAVYRWVFEKTLFKERLLPFTMYNIIQGSSAFFID